MSILRIVLFFTPHQKEPTGDHLHEEEKPIIEQRFEKDTSVSQDEVDKHIDTMVNSLIKEEHDSASLSPSQIQARIDAICSIYDDVCNKTLREGEYTPQQRLFYQGIIIFLLKKVDTQFGGDYSVRDTFSYIKLFEDNEARRGSAGHTYIKLNVGKIGAWSEFWEVLTHELGHVIDLGVLVGDNSKKDKNFTEFQRVKRPVDDPSIDFYKISRQSETVKKSGVTHQDFVSGYAMKGIYEDFAEGANLYNNHNAVFKKLASENPALKKKYDYYERLFNTQYFNSSLELVPKYPDKKRFWDTTKIKNELR